MERLIAVGFERVGSWGLVGGKAECKLEEQEDRTKVLYAFVSGKTVMYIGKTSRSLKSRMYGYENPGRTQRTNITNNGNILKLLSEGRPLDVYALADDGMLQRGQFHINVAAGLEDSLIAAIGPEWNKMGKSQGLRRDRTLDATENNGRENPEKTRDWMSFSIKIGKTYFNQGFFNVPLAFAGLFGDHGASIAIEVEGETQAIKGLINRNANIGGTPRIFGRRELRDWFRKNFGIGEKIAVEVICPDSIRLRR